MKLEKNLELSYIPYSYWNEKLSGFKIITRKKTLSKERNFFLIWAKTKADQKDFENYIKLIFPSIPPEKLITCQINIAFPTESLKFFKIITISGKIVPITPMAKLLYTIKFLEASYGENIEYSDSIKTWIYLTKLLFEMLNKGQFVPKMEICDAKYHKSSWKVLLKSENDRLRFKTIVDRSPWTSFCLPTDFLSSNGEYKSEGLWHPSYLFSLFLDDTGDSLIRSILNQKDFVSFREYYSTEIKSEGTQGYKPSWDYKFLKSLISQDSLYKIEGYHETILPSLIQNWTQSVETFSLRFDLYIKFEIEHPEKGREEWPLSISIMVGKNIFPINEIWGAQNLLYRELKNLQEREEYYLEYILRALGRAARIFPPIKRALEKSFQSKIFLSADEILSFLKYPKDLLIQSGFNVVLPDVFRRGGKQRLSNKLVIRSKSTERQKGGSFSKLPSLFDINSLIDMRWDIKIGGSEVTNDQLNQIVTSNQPLINLDGEWVLIEREDLQELKTLKKPEIKTYMDALRFGITGKFQSEQGNEYDVIIEGEFEQIIESIINIEKFESIPVPSLFKGDLRTYQQEGLNWMVNLAKFNFGLCLADDMGLGKTIQVIAFLSYLKENFPKNPGSYLIICPTSILFNWHRELYRFAPELEITVHHGANRNRDLTNIKMFTKSHHIFLTSYGTIRNDIEILETIQFSGIIIDESQNMKNYYSQQTRAINRLNSQFKICLSGTPIENKLLELWSLFNFLNPGLLGIRGNFQKDFIIPIERFQDQQAINKLKLIINPFIMRRVKSDKKIINDLPEKNEMKIFVQLTEDQEQLYQDLVNSTLQELQASHSDKRKSTGLILSLLVKLKQVCNHPYQFLKKDINSMNFEDNLKEIISKSKKLKRLVEMTEEVILNKEKVLIFTQFTQMGDIIKEVLKHKFNLEILYFHGGVSEPKRKEIVDKFQSNDIDGPPIMVLSLKAGGTGLNLTQGTTVIHFDRWWNPAVEDQATDRAYRIGQKSIVNVYKFISKGTVEEKVDALLEEKKDLADKIITTTGESWIADLEGEKLKELLALSR